MTPFFARDPAVKSAPYSPAACASLARSPNSPILSTPIPLAPPATYLICTQCDSFYVGETKMNDHQSSSNLPLPVAIHTRSHQLSFDSCWNVRVLQNLPLILITSPTTILNLPINSFCPLDTALVLTSDNSLLNFPPSLPLSQPPGGIFQKLSCDAIFVMCLHTFTLFWLRKTSVTIKIFWISFRVCVCLSIGDLFNFW